MDARKDRRPAPDRTSPLATQSGYLLHRTLTTQIRRRAPQGVEVLDIGCGSRPYELFFGARRYVGVDVAPGPGVDVVARGEDLPIADASFDCVLCSQVLEHAERPDRVVAEACRVLRPGGTALISTHGVIRYHAAGDVEDYWRWTHAGLHRLVADAGDWTRIDVIPNGGAWTAIAFLAGRELEASLGALRAGRLAGPAVFALNALGWNADRVTRRMNRGAPALSANYLVAATKMSAAV